MVERMQELNLPNAVVGRLIKDTLPEGINASKEFRMAISRAASVFVIFLSSAATEEAVNHNVKTLTAEHIFAALEETEFESFVQPLKETLEAYRKSVKEKKDSKLAPAPAADAAAASTPGGKKQASPTKKQNGVDSSDAAAEVETVDD